MKGFTPLRKEAAIMSKRKKIRSFFWFLLTKPIFGYISFMLFVIMMAVAQKSGVAMLLNSLLFPWFFLLFMLLNAPFIGTVFRGFQMTKATKRNHVLEHGTIYMLLKKYGDIKGIGGMAEKNGFSISGVTDKSKIRKAFTEVRDLLKNNEIDFVIAKKCGSNIVTAQGYGIILLTITLFLYLFVDITVANAVIIFGLNALIYFLFRVRIANWMQYRLFMNFDFDDTTIKDINKLKKTGIHSRPGMFVSTNILSDES